MITIDNTSHDRIIKLIESLELKVSDLTESNHSQSLPSLGKALASLETAQKMFDIVNGNS